MKLYVVTVHRVDNRHRLGGMVGRPRAFDSWEAAMDYGRSRVDYTRTDFRITETEMEFTIG